VERTYANEDCSGSFTTKQLSSCSPFSANPDVLGETDAAYSSVICADYDVVVPTTATAFINTKSCGTTKVKEVYVPMQCIPLGEGGSLYITGEVVGSVMKTVSRVYSEGLCSSLPVFTWFNDLPTGCSSSSFSAAISSSPKGKSVEELDIDTDFYTNFVLGYFNQIYGVSKLTANPSRRPASAKPSRPTAGPSKRPSSRKPSRPSAKPSKRPAAKKA
jgi:hypothetical protein